MAQLVVEEVELLLHLGYVGKGCLGFFHDGAAVGEDHYLWEVAYGDVLLACHLSVGGLL